MRFRYACMLLVALPLVSACETPPSNVERHFGNAVNNGKAMMIASTKDGRQPLGISGSTARGISINYHWNQNAVNSLQRRANAQGILGVQGH